MPLIFLKKKLEIFLKKKIRNFFFKKKEKTKEKSNLIILWDKKIEYIVIF